jgi:hypothetical protein
LGSWVARKGVVAYIERYGTSEIKPRDTHRPELRPRVEQRIRVVATRDGCLNDPQFGRRMSGSGAYAETIRNAFAAFSKRFGLDRSTVPCLRWIPSSFVHARAAPRANASVLMFWSAVKRRLAPLSFSKRFGLDPLRFEHLRTIAVGRVRWLGTAFFWHQSFHLCGEKERHSQSGVEPPHSKESHSISFPPIAARMPTTIK